jgi:hypothetical protein
MSRPKPKTSAQRVLASSAESQFAWHMSDISRLVHTIEMDVLGVQRDFRSSGESDEGYVDFLGHAKEMLENVHDYLAGSGR